MTYLIYIYRTHPRLFVAMGVIIIMFILADVLSAINTDGFQVVFYYTTLVSVAIISSGVSVFQVLEWRCQSALWYWSFSPVDKDFNDCAVSLSSIFSCMYCTRIMLVSCNPFPTLRVLSLHLSCPFVLTLFLLVDRSRHSFPWEMSKTISNLHQKQKYQMGFVRNESNDKMKLTYPLIFFRAASLASLPCFHRPI